MSRSTVRWSVQSRSPTNDVQWTTSHLLDRQTKKPSFISTEQEEREKEIIEKRFVVLLFTCTNSRVCGCVRSAFLSFHDERVRRPWSIHSSQFSTSMCRERERQVNNCHSTWQCEKDNRQTIKMGWRASCWLTLSSVWENERTTRFANEKMKDVWSETCVCDRSRLQRFDRFAKKMSFLLLTDETKLFIPMFQKVSILIWLESIVHLWPVNGSIQRFSPQESNLFILT